MHLGPSNWYVQSSFDLDVMGRFFDLDFIRAEASILAADATVESRCGDAGGGIHGTLISGFRSCFKVRIFFNLTNRYLQAPCDFPRLSELDHILAAAQYCSPWIAVEGSQGRNNGAAHPY